MDAEAVSVPSGKKKPYVGLAIIIALIVIGPFLLVRFAGIVAGFVIVNLAGTNESAKSDLARSFVKGALSTQITVYKFHNETFPPDLQALVTAPASSTNWRGPYLSETALDPWYHPYQYVSPGIHNSTTFDVFSLGPDGRAGTADDIGNWPSQVDRSK
jgi:general secretion pathway protein G